MKRFGRTYDQAELVSLPLNLEARCSCLHGAVGVREGGEKVRVSGQTESSNGDISRAASKGPPAPTTSPF